MTDINTTSPDFEVGDWVVFIGQSSTSYTKGKLYEVSDIDKHFVHTKEDDSGSNTNGHTPNRFQKIRFLGEWDGKEELPKYVLRPTYKGGDPDYNNCKTYYFSRKMQLSSSQVKDGIWWWATGTEKEKSECYYQKIGDGYAKYKEPLKLAWTHPEFKCAPPEEESTPEPPPVEKKPTSGLKTMESDFYFLIINEHKYFDD